MAQTIKGKTAIVTGAGSGINLEFARLLLVGGANVIFADLALRPESEKLVSEYSQSSPRAVFQKTDVTSWKDLEAMFAIAMQQFGSVDIVCPGAGVFEPPSSAFWIPPGTGASTDARDGDRYKLLDINITHPVRVTQLAISHFLAAKPPVSPSNPKTIVHISSIAGETANLVVPLYHTSKFAIVGLVRSLADLEQYCGIRVAAVLPGVVKTPLWMDNPDKLRLVDEETDGWVTPVEVAEAMLAVVDKNEISTRVSEEGHDKRAGKIPIKGGSMLEIAAGSIRDVPAFMNPGPAQGTHGLSVSNGALLYQEILQSLKPGWGQ